MTDQPARCPTCGDRGIVGHTSRGEDGYDPCPDCGPDWSCPRCGSTRWVRASLTGPVSHGGKAIRQCVPCGYYSDDPADPEAPTDD